MASAVKTKKPKSGMHAMVVGDYMAEIPVTSKKGTDLLVYKGAIKYDSDSNDMTFYANKLLRFKADYRFMNVNPQKIDITQYYSIRNE